MTIYCNAYLSVKLTKGDNPPVEHSLIRRMTGLQKVTVAALDELRQQYPKVWNGLQHSPETTIYYTSPYGEVDVMQRTAQAVLERDFPLSPTDFQNSVVNAAVSYAQIIFGLNNGSIATSQGFLSLDKTLFTCFQSLGYGAAKEILVIHSGSTSLWDGDDFGKSEVILLSSQAEKWGTEPLCELQAVEFKSKGEVATDVYLKEASAQVAWLNLGNRPSQTRLIEDAFGERIYSRWKS